MTGGSLAGPRTEAAICGCVCGCCAIMHPEREAASLAAADEPALPLDIERLATADHEWSMAHERVRCAAHYVPVRPCTPEDHREWAEAIVASLNEGGSAPPEPERYIEMVVGNGDGTVTVTLDDGAERRITEAEYLAWPRRSVGGTPR